MTGHDKGKTGRERVDAIYLHIPFCIKKCEYCDFCTFINMEREYERYTEALIKEIRMYPAYEYDTVYIGGGTPSLLPAGLITSIMGNIRYKSGAEVTLELNPDDMDRDKLERLRDVGINRLSIGIQSFQDDVLKVLGRNHTGEQAIKVFEEARQTGFSNISVDLMFGIPGQTMPSLKKDLDMIGKLFPENISIYSLIWEEGTVFWSKLKKGLLSEMDQDMEAEMYEMIIDDLCRKGYVHYEISNFARDGKWGRHNMKYWQNRNFIGAGLSAASYYAGRRYSNTRKFPIYYRSIEEGRLPTDEGTVEAIDIKEKEKLSRMLGFRLISEGIAYFSDERIDRLISAGLIEKFLIGKEKRLRLTRKGILLANDVFVEFV